MASTLAAHGGAPLRLYTWHQPLHRTNEARVFDQPPRDPAPESTRISDHALGRTSGAELREGNSLVLLRNGYATFADWLRAIRGAERWIHLENYIFFDGEIGRAFADALAERVEAGVTVRVL